MAGKGRAGGGKPFGSGRILFWRGGSIWIGHAAEETGFHAHHAIQLTIALSEEHVRFRVPDGNWTPYRAAIVAAHQSHAFKAAGQLVALVFAEPESLEGRRLRERFLDGIAALDMTLFAEEASRLPAAYVGGAPDDEVIGCARAVTAKLASVQSPSARPLDPRIERALGIVRQELDHTLTMTGVAEAVHLSPERFRHLFLEQTGIRFCPYVLWVRLETAVASYAAGSSLTDASHAAGFADSVHFSRTFKRMFGVQAIGVQRE